MSWSMVTKLFRNPLALSSALAALGTLQPRALGFLNSLVTLVLAFNYYLVQIVIFKKKWNLNKKIPGVKKSSQELKRPCWKRFETEMDGQGLLLLIGLKMLIIMSSLQTLLFQVLKVSWCWWDQNFDKDDQATKQCSLILRLWVTNKLNL